ncbi:MAG: flagellar basal body P-ring formation chaperone FlgA [Candidatus Hydrogenedentes bacterium]|nr:flagellar basal body P-ring formation chaperone FlgA [Candidatus Hydrogenedentota bacterium]
MRRARILGIAVAALLPMTAWAEPADTVMLKTEAYVKGPMVTLGEVAEIKGENAPVLGQIELGGAAAPGASKRLDATLVRTRIESAGVQASDITLDGANAVVAKTLSMELTQDILAEDLFAFIESKVPWKLEDTEIEVEHQAQSIVVPEGELSIKWSPQPQYRWIGPTVFRGEIRVDGDVKRSITMKAKVDALADVLVTTMDIPRGKLITPSDVQVEKRSLANLRTGSYVTELEDLVGNTARSTIFAGQVISPRQVVPPQLVKRNQAVTVETRAGGLLIRSRAVALGNAGAGEVLTCLNPDSKQEFVGTLRKDGIVVVE